MLSALHNSETFSKVGRIASFQSYSLLNSMIYCFRVVRWPNRRVQFPFQRNSTDVSTMPRWSAEPSLRQCSVAPTANHIADIAPSLQVDSQLAFIRDSLKMIKRLWLQLYHHDNLSSVTWDATSTEHFLMTILRQQEEVKRCVSQQSSTVLWHQGVTFEWLLLTSTLGLVHCPPLGGSGCLNVQAHTVL